MIDHGWYFLSRAGHGGVRAKRGGRYFFVKCRNLPMITPCSDIEHSTSKGCVITDGAVAACRGAGIMSFVDLLEDLSFDSETIEVITEAFETACRELGLIDRRDPITETLALKIIEAAQTGERDPDLIRQQAMESLAGKSSA